MRKQKQIKSHFLDSAWFQKNSGSALSFYQIRQLYGKSFMNTKATLFSRGKRAESFFTEDSRLYIAPREYKLLQSGIKLNRQTGACDSLSSRIVRNYKTYRPGASDFLYKRYLRFLRKYNATKENIDFSRNFFSREVSLAKTLNASIIGAILLGMASMSLIYHYLGQTVSAEDLVISGAGKNVSGEEIVLGVEKTKSDSDSAEEKKEKSGEWTEEDEEKYISQVIEYMEDEKKKDFEKKIEEMVEGYPIEEMIPYILEKDRIVAAFLVAIAKKESNWGKRVPVLNGQDCYNYWGYRGKRKLMGTGGHTCFNSRKDAVDTVAKRIEWLVKNNKLNTPEKMIIWKCGSSCSGHSNESVRKWISDVDLYFNKLNE